MIVQVIRVLIGSGGSVESGWRPKRHGSSSCPRTKAFCRQVRIACVIASVGISPQLFASTALALPSFVQAWGTQGGGPGQFRSPTVVAVGAAGNVYVADGRIQVFTGTGGYVTQWGSFGTQQGQFITTTGLAIDGVGDVYVADLGGWRIQKFTSAGVYLTEWQIIVPDAPFAFASPCGIAVDRASGTVFCTDSYNNRIHVTTGTGSPLAGWGSEGSGNGQFKAPCALALDSAGNIYVADTGNNRIQKFTTSGLYLTEWVAPVPTGLAVDGNGNIQVVENQSGGIEVFTSSGVSLLRWGTYGSGNGEFDRPSGIALDGGGNIFVADTDNHRIEKFFDASTPTEKTTWGGIKLLYR